MAPKPRPVLDRFFEQVVQDDESGCWNWQGTKIRGYGQIWVGPKGPGDKCSAHRFSYRTFVGPIPDGFQVDRLCENRSCCNPGHLEAVTAQVNTLRSNAPSAFNARKTHCKRGHEFTAENTYLVPAGRLCKTCRREATRAWRKRGAVNA